MQTPDIINRKKNNCQLTAAEIEHIVEGYTTGKIPDYQMSAFLMAVYFRGFSPPELTAYTQTLVNSGETLSWNTLSGGIVADKHSTGGVGDKTTLIVAPLLAAAGIYIPKMSGRGLGYTGGTIDKLESIPGFNPELTIKQMQDQVARIGLAVVSQTGNLTPADGKIYALRDVTSTVDSIPLIAASVMSKKLAGGAAHIILDVKTGSGAFMKTEEEAAELAETMVTLGRDTGRQVKAVVTDMNQPLGNAVGNALEIEEVVNTLKDEGPGDLKELSLTLAAHLLHDTGKAGSFEAAYKKAEKLLSAGKAYEKFLQMIEAQGGDPGFSDKGFLRARLQEDLKAPQSGYLQTLDALQTGKAAALLGAGRFEKGDRIDSAAGIIIHAKAGEWVEEGMPVMTLYTNDQNKIPGALAEAQKALTISETPTSRPQLIHRVMSHG